MLAMASCDCGRDKVHSGYVVGKHYEPARTYPYYDVTLHINRVRHIPEKWVVYVADSCRVRRLSVQKSTFDAVELGEYARFTVQGVN